MRRGTSAGDDSLRKQWSRLAQTAVWIMGVLGAFLTRPPGLAVSDDRRIVPFAGFIVATLLGLGVVVSARWHGPRHTWWWWTVALAFTALSVAGFIAYDTYVARWTEEFASTRIVVGTQWTPTGEKARHDYPSVKDMLPDFGGQADVLWDKDQLEGRRQALAMLYLGCVAVSALTMMSVVSAINCLSKERAAGSVNARSQEPEA